MNEFLRIFQRYLGSGGHIANSQMFLSNLLISLLDPGRDESIPAPTNRLGWAKERPSPSRLKSSWESPLPFE